jgi:hypothetical protein
MSPTVCYQVSGIRNLHYPGEPIAMGYYEGTQIYTKDMKTNITKYSEIEYNSSQLLMQSSIYPEYDATCRVIFVVCMQCSNSQMPIHALKTQSINKVYHKNRLVHRPHIQVF